MIPPLAKVGRVIAPDLVGFGRSDKPVAANAYTYKSHARWLRGFVEALDLKNATMVCQDWGGLLGLRILGGDSRAVRAAGGDEHGHFDRRPGQRGVLQVAAFFAARGGDGCGADDAQHAEASDQRCRGCCIRRAISVERIPDCGASVSAAGSDPAGSSGRLRQCTRDRAAEDTGPAGPAGLGRRRAITAPAEPFLRSIFKNVAPKLTIAGAGHFIQEDAGEEVAGAHCELDERLRRGQQSGYAGALQCRSQRGAPKTSTLRTRLSATFNMLTGWMAALHARVSPSGVTS